jgi:hypothetical protein
MHEHRECYRFPTRGTAKYLRNSSTDWYACFITNFSSQGIGIGIPCNDNIRIGSNLELTAIIHPLSTPITITGTIMWCDEFNGYYDYDLVVGIKCREITPVKKWNLLGYAYSHCYVKSNNIVTCNTGRPSTRKKELAPLDHMVNNLVEQYALVENIMNIRARITVTVNNQGWLKLSKSQRYAFADKLYQILSSMDYTEQIVVTNGDGNRLASVVRGGSSNRYMVVAG